MFTVGNFLMFSYYDYTFHASDDTHKEYMPIPKWVFMMSAINLFAYHTLGSLIFLMLCMSIHEDIF